MSLTTYEVIGNIAVIGINTPPVNALNQSVRQGIKTGIETANVTETIQGVILYGVGRTFIAGADIKEFGKPPLEPFLPDVCTSIESSKKPVLAVLHGTPLGGGLEVALCAHARIAQTNTQMGLPEVSLGIIPGSGATQRLPRLINVENAIEMITTGKRISAETALDMGLIDSIFTDSDILQAGLAYIQNLLDKPAPTPICHRAPMHPISQAQIDTITATLTTKSRGKIAPLKALETILLCQSETFEDAMKNERKTFLELQKHPQRLALRHIFKADRTTHKIPDTSTNTQYKDIKTVAIIGLGNMGSSIAMCFANANINVIAIETNSEQLDVGMKRIQSQYEASLKRGVYSQKQIDIALSNITPETDISTIKNVDLVLEAVFENIDVKTELLQKIDSIVSTDTIIATNTSYLNVNTLASQVSHPERVVGLHFFSPAHVMKLLEIVRTDTISNHVLQTTVKLAKTIRKIPVISGVCDGFIGNRMMQSYFRQAEYIVEDGASPYMVDTAMQDFGFGMGIFAIGDLSGLDISYSFRRSQDAIRPKDMRYPALADKIHDMGRLGRKTGKGWYDYTTDKRGSEDPQILSLLDAHRTKHKIDTQEFTVSDITWHILCALVNEGANILSEHIAYRASDIDVVWVRGYSFPEHKGGPMFWADQAGLDKILSYVQQQYKSDSYNWNPAPILQNLVHAGKTFADYDKDGI